MHQKMTLMVVAALCAALTPAVAAAAPSPPPAPAPGSSVPVGDLDGNGIADPLDAILRDLAPDAVVEVIVMADSPIARSQAEGRLGPFELDRRLDLVDGFSATTTAARIRGLARMPGVERVQANGRARIAIDSSQRDHGTAEARAQYGVDGTGVGICVADTGLDPAHEQLDGVKIVGWSDQINGQPAAYDDHGHGTHVAGIATGDGTGGVDAPAHQGVAPGADLYGVKVLDATGFGTDAQIVAGIEWCTQQPGVDIISMSLGSETSTDGLDALSVAADNAVNVHGKVVVAAAGNSGDADETVAAPGAAFDVVTVGASAEWSGTSVAQQSDGLYLAPFSGRGPTLDGRIKPDVVAPGVTVSSALAGAPTGYTVMSGTSMATPYVAGLAALLLDADPALTPAQIKTALRDTARDLGPAGTDNHWGAGVVDGLAAVASTVGAERASASAPVTHLVGTVPDQGEWLHEFEVGTADLGHPVALTLLIDGDFPCLLFLLGICFLQDMEADLDVEVRDPAGTLVQDSGCPLFHDCGTGGRQETIHFRPTVAGTHELRVFPFADPTTGAAPGGSFEADLFVGPPPVPVILPGGGWTDEGDTGTTPLTVPVTLSAPSALPVVVDWETFYWPAEGMAQPGDDYVPASGTVTFAPGQTSATVTVDLLGDTVDEPGVVFGEWIWVRFIPPATNATIDRSFFGLGAGVILNDD